MTKKILTHRADLVTLSIRRHISVRGTHIMKSHAKLFGASYRAFRVARRRQMHPHQANTYQMYSTSSRFYAMLVGLRDGVRSVRTGESIPDCLRVSYLLRVTVCQAARNPQERPPWVKPCHIACLVCIKDKNWRSV